MMAIWFLALKDIQLLFRDRGSVFGLFIFPILIGVMFGSLFAGSGTPRPLMVYLVDEDRSEGSVAYAEALGKNQSVKLIRPDADIERDLGRAPTPEELRERALLGVRKGWAGAAIVLEKGFGESFGIFGGPDSPGVAIASDPSRAAQVGLLQGVMTQVAFQTLAERFTDPARLRNMLDSTMETIDSAEDLNPIQKGVFRQFFGSLQQFVESMDRENEAAAAADPKAKNAAATPGFEGLRFRPIEVVREDAKMRDVRSYEVTFPQACLWGLIAVAMGFAAGIARERAEGTYTRLCLSPMSRMRIVVAKALAAILMAMLVMVAILGLGIGVFGVRVQGVPQMVMALVCSAFSYVGIAMVVSTVGRTEQAVGSIGWGVMSALSVFGGGMLPLAFMPEWMIPVSHFVPMKWGIVALEGAIWRGYTIPEMLLPCGILLAVGIAGTWYGAWVMERRAN